MSGHAGLSLICGMPSPGALPRLAARSATVVRGGARRGMSMTQIVGPPDTGDARSDGAATTDGIDHLAAPGARVAAPPPAPPHRRAAHRRPPHASSTAGPAPVRGPVWPAVVLDLLLALALAADHVGSPGPCRGRPRSWSRPPGRCCSPPRATTPPGAGPETRVPGHRARRCRCCARPCSLLAVAPWLWDADLVGLGPSSPPSASPVPCPSCPSDNGSDRARARRASARRP